MVNNKDNKYLISKQKVLEMLSSRIEDLGVRITKGGLDGRFPYQSVDVVNRVLDKLLVLLVDDVNRLPYTDLDELKNPVVETKEVDNKQKKIQEPISVKVKEKPTDDVEKDEYGFVKSCFPKSFI